MNEKEFICPRCERTVDSDKRYADCRYCGQAMMEKPEWDRRQRFKAQQPAVEQLEKR